MLHDHVLKKITLEESRVTSNTVMTHMHTYIHYTHLQTSKINIYNVETMHRSSGYFVVTSSRQIHNFTIAQDFTSTFCYAALIRNARSNIGRNIRQFNTKTNTVVHLYEKT